MRFAGQVAVVTGGALGIGGGISRRLAAAGAHVVLADINADAASVTHDDITAAGGRCTVVGGDIRDRDVVAEVTKTALAVDDSVQVVVRRPNGMTHDMLAAVWGSPMVIDGKVYLGDEDGDVVVLEAAKAKKLLGEVNMGSSVYATAVPANGTLFMMNRNQLFALAEKK